MPYAYERDLGHLCRLIIKSTCVVAEVMREVVVTLGE